MAYLVRRLLENTSNESFVRHRFAEGRALDELVAALDRPSLRFGGNSVDRRVWWTESNEPAPRWAEVTLRPADFQRLAAFVTKTNATVTLVTDLGHEDPKRAASMVFHAHRALGDRLVAVSIGNEPNGYALASQPQYRMRPDTWNSAAFIAQAREYEKAIHARVPGMRLIGPGTFDAAWLRAFGEARLPGTVAISQHWYPLWSCDDEKEPNAFPTVANLTSPRLHDRAAFILGTGLSTAARYGLPLWLEETGPTSCAGGTPTSRTHAQALWTSDFTLHAASMGIRRINHHGMIDTCQGGAPMSPLCDTGAFGTRAPHLRGQSNYLALLQLARLRTGAFLPVTVAGNDRVYAYAIADGKGIDVVVVNLNDPQAVGASPLELTMPSGFRSTQASVLHADSLDARNGSKLVPWSPADVLPKTVNAGSVLALRLTRG
jgi:hypothetical protein